MTTYPQKRKPGRISAAFSFEEELSDCLFCFFLPGTTPTLKSRLSIVSSFGKACRPFYAFPGVKSPWKGKTFFVGKLGRAVVGGKKGGKRKSTHRGLGDQARLGSRRKRRRAIRQHQQRKLTGRGFNKNRRAIVFHQPELHERACT